MYCVFNDNFLFLTYFIQYLNFKMTHTFSVHEYIDMVKFYFRNNESHRQAAYSYGIEYPDRKKPSYNVINRLMSRFLETGKIALFSNL